MTIRIKYVTPYAFGRTDLGGRAVQVARAALLPGTEVVVTSAKNTAGLLEGHLESLLLDVYITEAGLTAEEEGFDAVMMDTVSDSGLTALRSRLTIPVIGPGLVAYVTAGILGRRFAIITIWDSLRHIYEKGLQTYGLAAQCVSIRSAEAPKALPAMDSDAPLPVSGADEALVQRIIDEAERAIEDDGADVIILGSTTMHEAADGLSAAVPVPVINPGPLGLKIAESLVLLRLTHSRRAFPSSPTTHDEKFHSLLAAAQVAEAVTISAEVAP
jgi:allantoin racemase